MATKTPPAAGEWALPVGVKAARSKRPRGRSAAVNRRLMAPLTRRVEWARGGARRLLSVWDRLAPV